MAYPPPPRSLTASFPLKSDRNPIVGKYLVFAWVFQGRKRQTSGDVHIPNPLDVHFVGRCFRFPSLNPFAALKNGCFQVVHLPLFGGSRRQHGAGGPLADDE